MRYFKTSNGIRYESANGKYIRIAWRKALKIIWNLPYATHKRILSFLFGSAPVHIQLKARLVKFMHKALNYNNSEIKSATKYACNSPMSVCSRNWREFVCVNGIVTESVKGIGMGRDV